MWMLLRYSSMWAGLTWDCRCIWQSDCGVRDNNKYWYCALGSTIHGKAVYAYLGFFPQVLLCKSRPCLPCARLVWHILNTSWHARQEQSLGEPTMKHLISLTLQLLISGWLCSVNTDTYSWLLINPGTCLQRVALLCRTNRWPSLTPLPGLFLWHSTAAMATY